MTAQGVTGFPRTLARTDMELPSVLKAAAQGAAQRPTSRLGHRTLGIRLRELAGYISLTAHGVKAVEATLQQPFMERSSTQTYTLCSFSEGKPMEAF